jgi:hypothetical protein
VQISKLRLAVAGVVTAASFSLVGAGVAQAFQPHMVSARDHLNAALNELQAAEADKGGHRQIAIDRTREALDQTNQGIAWFDSVHR